jgi:hypothetical protein
MYSKNGSIPKPETDGTDGWIEVPDAPIAPEGKEVVWWYPPGWVIRDPKPEGNWSWSQSEEKWVEIVQPQITEVVQTITSTDISSLSSSDINALTSSQISGLNG